MADVYDHLNDTIETERTSSPDLVDRSVETYPERLRTAGAGQPKPRTGESLPYGLAIYDDRFEVARIDE